MYEETVSRRDQEMGAAVGQFNKPFVRSFAGERTVSVDQRSKLERCCVCRILQTPADVDPSLSGTGRNYYHTLCHHRKEKKKVINEAREELSLVLTASLGGGGRGGRCVWPYFQTAWPPLLSSPGLPTQLFEVQL